MKRLMLVLFVAGLLFSQEERVYKEPEVKLGKDENLVGFFAVAQKIENNIIDFGKDGKITIKSTALSKNKNFLVDTLGIPISLNQMEFPALLEIKAVVKGGPYELIYDIIKNIKRVIRITYHGKAENKK